MSMLSENHIYSYSQLSQFDDCPYSFYLSRIEKEEQDENAFSQYGTLMHSIIERWADKEITKDEMVDVWKDEYDNVVTKKWPRFLASKGYADKTYQDGINYLENFDEFSGFTVIAAEKKFTTDIAGRPFVGIIDLILRDNETNEIVIVDHKSKTKSTFKKSANSMYRQILIYSKHIFEEYGVFPARMRFNLFKESIYDERKFNKEDYDSAMDWAKNIIEKIESYDILDWMQAKDRDFFCENICSVRNSCENGKPLK